VNKKRAIVAREKIVFNTSTSESMLVSESYQMSPPVGLILKDAV
jgi:hypothetical protein